MSGVRPTRRCLENLGLLFPSLDVALDKIKHDLIAKSQRLPEEQDAGGAERVISIDDRIWLKVKIKEHRGAGGHISDGPTGKPSGWWLVAGGVRRADSTSQDFYSTLTEECERKARSTSAKVNSSHLLPQEIDYRRLELEQATIGVESLKRAVREAICQSAHSGRPVVAETKGQRLIAYVKSRDGETYLAVVTEGFLDPNQIAIILSAVPGMDHNDWGIEPDEVLGIRPDAGQLVYSAMLPPESLAEILEESPGGYL
ncbi:hypothetical protein [Citricoccus sp. NR2]|uniref:hypothetical protein n=1 Tax=Citricoccus sp. NR2 TaxID=3004095 RepID=UPI0022DD43D1|nr:hypothetical protein [Citricoccus sp. NR2]WBL20236.1 hypothetical protein O1A05_06020 [Citricoccus sp. NR2]